MGLLDTEKNYMIVVTKEGKLITVDFDGKTKVTKCVPGEAKVGDIGLGAEASINYVPRGDKNLVQSIEFKVKGKGGR